MMLKNGQTYFENLAVFIPYVWPFFNIMLERDNLAH